MRCYCYIMYWEILGCCYLLYKAMSCCGKIIYYNKCSKAYLEILLVLVFKILWRNCSGYKCIGFGGKVGGAVHDLYCNFLRLAIVLGIELS